MKTTYLFGLATLLFFSACQWEKASTTQSDIFTDTLTYDIKSIKELADDCKTTNDSACTKVSIKYPVFKDQLVLNDSIENKLITLFGDDKAADLITYSKNFIKQYTDLKKDNPDWVIPHELTSAAKILRQDSGLVTLDISGYMFQGGAHGSSIYNFVNWNTTENKQLKLSDLLIDNYTSDLTKIAEKIFRANEKLSDTASLANNYFFKDNRFSLNDNFLITPSGLKFLYNQYEIKPYAAGQTELAVPYDHIKQLLKPNTVISQFVK